MPGENLTRIEAQERAAIVDVQTYDVELDLTRGAETFGSTTRVRFSATSGASTFIDAITRTVHSITLNGTALDVAAVNDGVRIQLDGLQEQNELVVVADALYTNTGEGLHRFVDPVDDEVYLYSQFEVPDSRRMFAVFEQPDLKAEFSFTVTAPSRWQVVSNSPTPEPHVDGEIATWTFAPTAKISSYITALVAGPYEVVRDELTSRDGRTIPLGVFARKSLAEYLDPEYVFDITKKGFAYYEEKFDVAYPFEKYDQLFVPEFNAGAMENAGAVTFTETYVFRSKVTDAIKERRVVTILHELAHMWFGDLVTMKWWNDLWLNESFAEWASTIATAEATEWTEAWTTFQAMEKSWAYRQDQLPSTHPIVATINDLEDVQVNFDGITYAKGGSVLKQLVAWVGIDAFFAGVSAYFKKHHHSNTELRDLLVELEATSGRDLSEWSKLWLETAGVNTLRPEIETDESGVITAFAVLQEAPADHPTLRPHRLAIGVYAFTQDADAPFGADTASAGGKLERIHRVEIDVDGPRTEVPELVGVQRGDLVLLNDDDLAYAKIRLDEQSRRTAIEHLASIANPLARSIVWGAMWDATRDAESPASDYVRLVLGNIATETESTTIRTTLSQLLLTARNYVAPAKADATVRTVGETLWQLASSAEAGSDAQFQFVKFFAQIASTPEHVGTLTGLRDGSVTLNGLEIDTDLRWELLEGLVLAGAAGNAEVDAELAADRTASGEQAAARARATIPTAEGKLAAFSSLVDSSELPNAIVRQTTVGYQHVNSPVVLEGLVPKYFDVLTRIWAERSYHIADTIVTGLYPAPLASAELRDAAAAWLEAHPETPALRRIVSESLAGTERALRVQAADA
ncbi:aminopeptidase N [Curtobacterium pusillum]|uniref:Aminopeptidase N n=1 Tax=Curtobacterium pusillum TaxID=69373 RepID=A0AAW3T9K7_9MICO|nr:aminopeptidase N [Curtobacterium pusillum]MBA8991380.1 aminopeptidase N [Curtobacterium pusillum]NUU13333.1 aminopeptidase N [Curtobacterium pusillum]GLK30841.1 aminopeptidase N [Curtobacterium pusillum]